MGDSRHSYGGVGNTAQINARDGHRATLESTPTYTLEAETVGGR